MITETIELKPPVGAAYQFRKWLAIVVCGIAYVFVYFHRFSTAVLVDQLAEDLHVEKGKLGIMSSMYFWPYGLIQPFVGGLADILEPGYMVGTACFISGIGTTICAVSKTLWLECVGKFLVGLGCGTIFVPTNKIAANWFTEEQFKYFAGALIGLGGVGSLLSQTPLSILGQYVHWRYILLGTAIISFIIGMISFIFVRGHPIKLGYFSPYPIPVAGKFKDVFSKLFHNMGKMCKIIQFWFLSMYMFFNAGASMILSSVYGVPFLTEIYGFSSQKASYVQMTLSASLIIGSPLLPVISNKVHSRKWTLFTFGIISTICAIIFILTKDKLNIFEIIALYFFYNFGAAAGQGTALSWFKEFAPIELAATLVGGGNTGPFIGGGLFMEVTSEVIELFGSSDPYPLIAYQVSLWGITAACTLIGTICLLFIPEQKAIPSTQRLDSLLSNEDHLISIDKEDVK